MSSNMAIKIEGLSKYYEIYKRPQDRLKQMIFPTLQRWTGAKIKKYYSSFCALKDLNIEIKKGETVGVIGLNGSGKSTLLKLICGILSATDGQIETNGRIAALLELGTGFNPEFTGKENIYLNGSILGLTENEINQRYDAIIEFADIGAFIDQPVKRYSSGMFVRLAFSVIANVNADILIIDEALAVGDAIFSQKCMRFLRNFKKTGTVLFVSHNSGAVVNLCDRAIWLEKGIPQAIGPAKEVCEQYLAKRYNSKTIDNRIVCKNQLPKRHETLRPNTPNQTRDMRMAFINNSNLRNDIQVFEFSLETKSFGNNGATIEHAGLEDLNGNSLSWIVGGEMARIVIQAKVIIECHNVVIGFNLKDRLGQILIGQNTYIDTCLKPIKAKPGDLIEAVFTFRLPILPRGNYAVDVAIADGDPQDVKQLRWIHDAFMLEAHVSSSSYGLIGLIYDSIELRNKSQE